MTITIRLTILFGILNLYSCASHDRQHDVEALFNGMTKKQSLVEYANGFDLFEKQGVNKLVVYEAGSRESILATYYITDSNNLGKFKQTKNLFICPIDSVALFSATQINAFKKLDLLDKIIGVSEANYINDSVVRDRIVKGEVTELAGSGNFYTEKAMMISPSVIFYSPYQGLELNTMKLTGIPLIPYYDYLEETPLGRAEWIKFSAVFFNRYQIADSIFQEISKNYSEYRQLAQNLISKPTVFSDKYFNGQWYIPGGHSYIAHLFADAGADYLWKNDSHTGSFPLDYEVVFNKAHDADFWRIVGSYGEEPSYESLAAQNELYRHFKAFREHKIIWCDAESTAYFEESPLEPDKVLADLIKAFHPELLPGYKPKYYHLMP
jgi:iron complex transport system substrate-binding protein